MRNAPQPYFSGAGLDSMSEGMGSVLMDGCLQVLIRRPSQYWVHNLDTCLRACEVDGHLLPLTVNDTEWDNAYVCSPYTAFVSYLREELRHLRSPCLAPCLKSLIGPLSYLLRWGRVNRVVHLNNWLLSTNLYPDWHGHSLPALHAELLRAYPSHSLIFRSLNRTCNASLMGELESLGYRLVPSRQVYFLDGRAGKLASRPDLRRDRRLLESTPYRVCQHQELTAQDFPRIVQLYNWLYLDKYSRHNPQFSEELVALWHETGALRFQGLRTPAGRLDGVIGVWERDGVLTVPLLGYDTALPQEIGLYRLLTMLIINYTVERRCLLHMSAGAAQFKRCRGARPETEYSAVYARHLALGPRFTWRLLEAILIHVALPLMRRYKL